MTVTATSPANETQPAANLATATKKLAAIRNELNATFLERSTEIDALLTCLLARKNLLLFGPPGTAKSAIVEAVCNALSGANYFEWLMSAGTTLEDVLGPIDLDALKTQHVYKRNVFDKLPEADIAFLDETFKSNSACLNAVLKIMNERKFNNGSRVAQAIPLQMLVGASNELPEGGELGAFFDRFAVRLDVKYLQDERNKLSVMLDPLSLTSTTQLTLEELALLQGAARGISFNISVGKSWLELEKKLAEEGLVVGDRRRRQIAELLRAYAFLSGDSEVSEDHFEFSVNCLWRTPKDCDMIARHIRSVGNAISAKATETLNAAKELVSRLANITDRVQLATELSKANEAMKVMIGQVDEMITAHPNRAKKAQKVKGELGKLQAAIVSQIKTLYNIS